MKRIPLSLLAGLAALVVTILPATAQRRARDLTLVDMFSLGQALTPSYEKPIAWIDDDHFLVADAGEGLKTFSSVDAKTGAKSVWLNADYAKSFAELAGVGEAQLEAMFADADAFAWTEDHRGFLVNANNDLFFYDAKSAARRLTHSAGDEVGEQISPDGRSVAFIHDYDLHVVGVDGGQPRSLTDGGHEDLFFGRLDWVYQEELYGRGNFQGYWWSPDSTRIALLRLDESPVKEYTLVSDTPVRPKVEVTNYPKAGEPNPVVDIGVVDVLGGEVRWFDLSRYGTTDTMIVRVTWAPKGDEVFFQVQNREQTWLEMLAGDASSGELRLVFREESPCWIEAGPEPVWLADGERFLWLSERDGYKHVYEYQKDGALIAQRTSGTWECDEILEVDEKADRVYFVSEKGASDKGDWKDQHLFCMLLDGSEITQISQQSGWHDVLLSPNYALYLDTYSNVDYRESVHVRSIDGKAVHSVVESRMKPFQLLTQDPAEFVQIKARDGFVMEARMWKPRGYVEGKSYPTMMFQYSGPHTPRVLNKWRWRDWLWHHYLAQKGYLVLAVDCRSGSGKGRVSAQSCFHRMGTTELQDLEDAVDWLTKSGVTDAARVGIWGWSYGGYQTCYNLTHSSKWKLGIAVNPVSDWRFYDTIYTERYMGLPQTNADGYKASSVLDVAGDLHGELLIVSATMDDNVHPQNSLSLAYELQKARKQFSFMPYPRVRHGIGDIYQQLHLFEMMTRFVEEKL